MIKIAELEFESIYEVEADIFRRIDLAIELISDDEFNSVSEILMEAAIIASCLSDYLARTQNSND